MGLLVSTREIKAGTFATLQEINGSDNEKKNIKGK